MKRKTLLSLIIVLLIAILLVACGGSGDSGSADSADSGSSADNASSADAASSDDSLKVVLFINGVLGDKSFFDSAQRGIDKAVAELGVQAETIEAGIDETTWEAALIDAAENKEYDVFIVGTWQMTEFLQKVAPKYPDKKFIVFDAPVDYENCECGNVYSILYKQNEGSYLAGVYAAAMTTEDVEGMNADAVIGSVGGQEIPVIVDFMVGYEQGAKDTNPDITVIRQFAGSWNDPAKGKELTKAQYSQGADIVFQIAGGTGQGVFEAAAEDGHYAIGVDSDQALIVEDADPDQAARILTSMMKNVDNSLFRALEMHLAGTAPYGEIEALGIAEGGVGLARNKFYDAATPDSVVKLVDAAEKDILAGNIVVDTAFK